MTPNEFPAGASERTPSLGRHELALEGLTLAIQTNIELAEPAARSLTKIRRSYRKRASRYLRVLGQKREGTLPRWKKFLGAGVSENPRYLRVIGEAYHKKREPVQTTMNGRITRVEELRVMLVDELHSTEGKGFSTLSEAYRAELIAILDGFAKTDPGRDHAPPAPREHYLRIRETWTTVCHAIAEALRDAPAAQIHEQILQFQAALGAAWLSQTHKKTAVSQT